MRTYARMQLAQLQSGMSHRGDQWLTIVGVVLQQSVSLVFLWVFFSHVTELGGWSVWDMAILQGMVLMAMAFPGLVGDGSWQLPHDVNEGNFDRVLVRPMSPVLQQAAARTSGATVGNLALAVVALGLGLSHADVAWAWWSVPLLVLAVVSGTLIHLAINLITNMRVFWDPGSYTSIPTLVSRMREFAKFPLTIYDGVMRFFVTILPLSFVAYFPTLLLLDRGGPERWLGLASPLVAALLAGIAALLWRTGVNKYQGVGH